MVRTYKFERYGTSIDFEDQDMERIMTLKRELETIFFVWHVFTKDKSQNSLFLSRFRNYFEDPLKHLEN